MSGIELALALGLAGVAVIGSLGVGAYCLYRRARGKPPLNLLSRVQSYFRNRTFNIRGPGTPKIPVRPPPLRLPPPTRPLRPVRPDQPRTALLRPGLVSSDGEEVVRSNPAGWGGGTHQPTQVGFETLTRRAAQVTQARKTAELSSEVSIEDLLEENTPWLTRRSMDSSPLGSSTSSKDEARSGPTDPGLVAAAAVRSAYQREALLPQSLITPEGTHLVRTGNIVRNLETGHVMVYTGTCWVTTTEPTKGTPSSAAPSPCDGASQGTPISAPAKNEVPEPHSGAKVPRVGSVRSLHSSLPGDDPIGNARIELDMSDFEEEWVQIETV